MADELEDIEAEMAELSRLLDESAAAEKEQVIAAELQRLTEKRDELRARREREAKQTGDH